MKKTLSRKWARTVIVLYVLCLIALAVLLCTNSWIWAAAAGAFFVFAQTLRVVALRCPHCGKTSPRPQWRGQGKYFCPSCGEKMKYDDE